MNEHISSMQEKQSNRPQTPHAPFPCDVQEVKFNNEAAGITLAGTLTLSASLIEHFSFQALGILIVVCVVSSAVAHKVFQAGLKRYESGNMMNVRM